MRTLFVDSSALAKRYLPEQGTKWIRQQFTQDENTVIVSRLSSVEVMSAVARRHREGIINSTSMLGIQNLLQRHFLKQYVVIEVNSDLTRDAVNLLTRHPLRAYDAIQLATAMFVNKRMISNGLQPVIFLCADTKLLQIADSEDLAAGNPDNHP